MTRLISSGWSRHYLSAADGAVSALDLRSLDPFFFNSLVRLYAATTLDLRCDLNTRLHGSRVSPFP